MSARHVDVAILSVGVAMELALVGALWRLATLKASVVRDWAQRVTVAEAGLETKAIDELKLMQDEIVDLLAPLGAPSESVADPGTLALAVRRYVTLMDARDKIRRHFHRLVQVGPVMMSLLIPGAVANAVAFTYFAGLTRARALGYAATWLGLGCATVLVAVFAAYVYLQDKLAGAELLATEDAT